MSYQVSKSDIIHWESPEKSDLLWESKILVSVWSWFEGKCQQLFRFCLFPQRREKELKLSNILKRKTSIDSDNKSRE